jgi:hypothetical protein
MVEESSTEIIHFPIKFAKIRQPETLAIGFQLEIGGWRCRLSEF